MIIKPLHFKSTVDMYFYQNVDDFKKFLFNHSKFVSEKAKPREKKRYLKIKKMLDEIKNDCIY